MLSTISRGQPHNWNTMSQTHKGRSNTRELHRFRANPSKFRRRYFIQDIRPSNVFSVSTTIGKFGVLTSPSFGVGGIKLTNHRWRKERIEGLLLHWWNSGILRCGTPRKCNEIIRCLCIHFSLLIMLPTITIFDLNSILWIDRLTLYLVHRLHRAG